MTSNVHYLPAGFHTATPYLCTRDAASAIAWYAKAFNATDVMRLVDPNGKIAHAQIQIGDSIIMLSDEYLDSGVHSPQSIGGSPVRINLFVEDVDATFKQAVAAGAEVAIAVADQFHGERSGRLVDPFGHVWLLSTHIEDVSPEEMQRRFDEMMKQ